MKAPNKTQLWEKCRPGSISKAIERKELVRKRNFVTNISSYIVTIAAITTLVLVFFLTSGMQHSTSTEFELPSTKACSSTSIGCEEVRELLSDFSNRRICNRELFQEVREHLRKCNCCKTQYYVLRGRN